MNRRSLPLLLALAAACSTAPAPGSGAAAAGPGFRFRGDFRGDLGVQLYSFRNFFRTDVPGTLPRVRRLGFREVELAGTYGLTPQQFRQELDRAGLRATAMHVGYAALRDSLDSVLDQARVLGVEYVGTASIPFRGKFDEAAARRTAADFNRWGRAARERGLQFYYHTHGFEFEPTADGGTVFDVLMRETDPALVQYEMDVMWVALAGVDPVALMRKYPDRWRLMHLKDIRKGTPVGLDARLPENGEVPVGQGLVDYPALLRAAREAGVRKYYIEDETPDPFGGIPHSTGFLETVRW